MGKISITESFFYRHRYIIGWGLVTISLIAVLLFAGLYLPGGISTAETASAVKSSSINYLNIDSLAITNLPYHALQQASFAIFGVSIFSIKLPSLMLAFLSCLGMILLLIRWFKPNISVLASLIAVTTGQFLFIAQDGTPGVLYLFWAVWLIYLAFIITTDIKYKTPLKILFFIIAALSLYTPLSIYMLVAIGTSLLVHPHLRYLLKQLPRVRLIIAFVFSIILTLPLIFMIIKTPQLGLNLLGIPSQWPDFMANLSSLGAQFLGFVGPSGGAIMTPIFELGSMLLIAIGLFSTIKSIAAARSYIILIWILCLLPFILLNPGLTTIMFLPLVLLLASGIKYLLTYWYDLFPRNPYARIGGLIPMVILVVVLVFSGADRYVYGYRYDPDLVNNFSKDIKLIPADTKNIVVSASELPFYSTVGKYNKEILVTTKPANSTFLATRQAKRYFPGYSIGQIITTPNQNDSDRFYLYKK
jgi:4-amino-4-deoxy-L-arabinose transferase-like glycosyltransferase